MLFPTRRQAPLTPAAVKASAGAVEHLLLAPVDDLAGALADLHGRGLRVAGSEADAPLTARQADLRGPLAIVIGSEGQGLGPAVRRRCDLLMRIPMRGFVGSLNAAVAGSILLFEAVAQRDPEGRAQPATPTALAYAEAGTGPRQAGGGPGRGQTGRGRRGPGRAGRGSHGSRRTHRGGGAGGPGGHCTAESAEPVAPPPAAASPLDSPEGDLLPGEPPADKPKRRTRKPRA